MVDNSDDLSISLRNFNDVELKRYTCFAGEFRDQRMEDGARAQAAFWNAVVNLCVDERLRREGEISRLEYMYRTGIDPLQEL